MQNAGIAPAVFISKNNEYCICLETGFIETVNNREITHPAKLAKFEFDPDFAGYAMDTVKLHGFVFKTEDSSIVEKLKSNAYFNRDFWLIRDIELPQPEIKHPVSVAGNGSSTKCNECGKTFASKTIPYFHTKKHLKEASHGTQ